MRTLRFAAVILLILTAGHQDPLLAQTPVLVEFGMDDGEIIVVPQAKPENTFRVDPAREVRGDRERWRLSDRLVLTPDSIIIDAIGYARHRLGYLRVEPRDRGVVVQIEDRGEDARPPLRSGHVTGVATELRIESDAFVRGYVLSFGGDVRVDGEVNRSVVAIDGDVYIEAGGVVRGSVVALGGDVIASDEAQIYGDVYAGNRRRFRPRWSHDGRQNIFDFSVALDYNRVTGVLPWAVFRVGPRDDRAPELKVDLGYAFESELWHHRTGIGRDPLSGPSYYAGAYRDTRDDDALRIKREENTLFALLFRTDYRDYYFAEGFTLQAGWNFDRGRSVRLSYHNELLEDLTANRNQWSLFGGDPHPANYSRLLEAGDPALATDFRGRLITLSVAIDFAYPVQPDSDDNAWTLGARSETSGEDWASDFEYTRYLIWLTRHQRVWHEQSLRVRASAGGSGGRLPATRYFYLGGIGSLRGFDHKALYGDRFWLTNLEYAWSFDTWEIFGLLDVGQIASDAEWSGNPVNLDVGLGLSVQRTFRVQIAWGVSPSSTDPLVTFRFSRPF